MLERQIYMAAFTPPELHRHMVEMIMMLPPQETSLRENVHERP